MVVPRLLFNPNIGRLVFTVEVEHSHTREIYVGSLVSGEAGHRVGTHARLEGRKYWRWLRRLHLVNKTRRACRAMTQSVTFAPSPLLSGLGMVRLQLLGDHIPTEESCRAALSSRC